MAEKKIQFSDQLKLVGLAIVLGYHFFVIVRIAGHVEERVKTLEREASLGRPLVERFFKTEERVNTLFNVCCERTSSP